jgi:hypothetical protein
MMIIHIQEFTILLWISSTTPSVETDHFPYSFTKALRKCSATNIFLSGKIWHPRTVLSER